MDKFVEEEEVEENAALIFDENDPGSIYNLVPPYIADKIRAIPQELWKLKQEDLKRKVLPGKTVEALRFSFWIQYNDTIFRNLPKINFHRVWGPICSEIYFYQKVLNSPMMLCWMLQPPQKYARCMEALLDTSMERIREIINLPIVDKRGKVDVNTAKLIVAIHNRIEDRVKGAIVQKSVSKQLSVNFSTPIRDANEVTLDRKLKELKDAEQRLLSGGDLSGESAPTEN